MQNANLTLFICCNVLLLLDHSIGYSPCFKAKKTVTCYAHIHYYGRKRSLGQGNVFTPICHSVHGGEGGLHPGGVCLGGSVFRGSACGGGGV